MSSLKLLNYFLISKSTPLHSFYSPLFYSPYIQYRFLCPKNPTFISSQSRLFSSATSSISYMELVKEVACKGPELQQNIAIRADEKSYSYLQLISSARRISNLLSKLNLKTDNGIKENEHHNGARVGIVAKPSAEFVAGILGTWLSGGCAVPLALSYPETELLHVMNDSDISIILSTEDHQELMNTIAAKTGAQLSVIPSIPNVQSSMEHDQSKDMVSDGQQNLIEINSYGEILGNLSVARYGYLLPRLRCLELINSIFLCSVHVPLRREPCFYLVHQRYNRETKRSCPHTQWSLSTGPNVS
ncbi:hypothetical protein HAX54_039188 [Datura stramonium]|uniref:AMP-dependent synthetase/ligase domain-containing protein n=1 Tax=Datura stramonium TaxID=4076 RepID=A0ABS8VML4_DATST|nr:hypothetical protein [Datura stramonium]